VGTMLEAKRLVAVYESPSQNSSKVEAVYPRSQPRVLHPAGVAGKLLLEKRAGETYAAFEARKAKGFSARKVFYASFEARPGGGRTAAGVSFASPPPPQQKQQQPLARGDAAAMLDDAARLATLKQRLEAFKG
jgi:hypothetical protein